jgi:hypothetical protein
MRARSSELSAPASVLTPHRSASAPIKSAVASPQHQETLPIIAAVHDDIRSSNTFVLVCRVGLLRGWFFSERGVTAEPVLLHPVTVESNPCCIGSRVVTSCQVPRRLPATALRDGLPRRKLHNPKPPSTSQFQPAHATVTRTSSVTPQDSRSLQTEYTLLRLPHQKRCHCYIAPCISSVSLS